MNKRNLFTAVSILLICFVALLAGCSTMRPVQSDSHYPTDGNKYIILGRVTLEADSAHTGYTKLIEQAKALYPNADDVVNIVVDAKVTSFFWSKKYKYILSGIAIHYTEVK